MHSIACLSQKGGVGKSTLARLIATVYARAGWQVAIADFNVKQTTSVDWVSRRLTAKVEPTIGAQAFSQVRQVVKALGAYDLVVFDGKPDSDATMLEVAKAADLVVIPTGVTLDDLLPQIRFANELRAAGIEHWRILFVVNKSADSELATKEARAFIRDAGLNSAENDIPVRTGYQVAQNGGRAICETTFPSLNERAEAAAQEIVGCLTTATEKVA